MTGLSLDLTQYLAIIGAAVVFLLFLVALSMFQVFWKRFWGNHDE
jgi:hypothetical protein